MAAWAIVDTQRGEMPEAGVFANSVPVDVVSEIAESPDAATEARPVDDGPDYFQLALSGRNIAFVIDSDQSMAPYLDDVALVTHGVAESLDPEACSFGISIATPQRPDVVDPAVSTDTGLSAAKSVLFGRFAHRQTDLAQAFSAVVNWHPDQVFLVLARKVDPRLREVIAQRAEQSGAVTHVIALGAARQQDLSGMVAMTQGRVHAVSDEAVRACVDQFRTLIMSRRAKTGDPKE
jgi:hypothetical protein